MRHPRAVPACWILLGILILLGAMAAPAHGAGNRPPGVPDWEGPGWRIVHEQVVETPTTAGDTVPLEFRVFARLEGEFMREAVGVHFWAGKAVRVLHDPDVQDPNAATVVWFDEGAFPVVGKFPARPQLTGRWKRWEREQQT